MAVPRFSASSAQKYYDWLGRRYDLFSFYEGRAKARAIDLLELAVGQRVLNVGLGTGKEHVKLMTNIMPGGLAAGIDLSAGMLKVARQRTRAPLARADASDLPFATATFDRILCTYVLDLIPAESQPGILQEIHRVLHPGGRAVIVSLTEGINLPSRALVALWKAAYAISPWSCGGCRPLQLEDLVRSTGFSQVRQEKVIQLGVPSEIIAANR